MSKNLKDKLVGLFGAKAETVSTAPTAVSYPVIHMYCEDTAVQPDKAHDTDSGFDVFSKEEVVVAPGQWAMVHTGTYVKIENNNSDYLVELQVRPKSGLAVNKGITVLNTPGTVDQGYTGEICVILMNHGGYPYIVPIHSKVAQLVVSYVPKVKIHMVDKEYFDNLTEDGDRKADGFGSTGLIK